jgi:hypothetical protein
VLRCGDIVPGGGRLDQDERTSPTPEVRCGVKCVGLAGPRRLPVYPGEADILRIGGHVSKVPILLQKSAAADGRAVISSKGGRL